jgi:RND family efflux transporter MFP subunit
MTTDILLFGKWRVGRGRLLGTLGAFVVSAVSVLAAASFSRKPPAGIPRPEGMKVGDRDVTLAAGAPQWSSLRLGKAVAAGSHWTDPVTARVRIDEAQAARIGSPLAGRVVSVMVELGQRVKKGDPLFSVASPDLASLRSDAAKAQVDLDVAKAQYQRVHDMVQTGLLPGKEELAASAEKRLAELQVRSTHSKIQSLKVASRKDNEFIVTAPRAGVIVEKNLLPSQEVSTEGTLVQIADVSDVWVVADVFESDAAGLASGTPAKITLPSLPGQVIEAKVDTVSAVVDPTRHSVPVRVRLANADGKLKPNQYAEMRFKIDLPANAVEVAASALVSDGARQYVYVEEAPGKFVRREVVAGPVRDGSVAISEGLKPGETVVVEGGILLDNQIELAH